MRLYHRVRQWADVPLDVAARVDPDSGELPALADVTAVESAAHLRLAEGLFVDEVFRHGDLDAAATTTVRKLMHMAHGRWQARALARAFAARPDLAVTGALCKAMIQTALPDKALAWPAFAQHDRAEALRLAAPEYLRAAAEANDPEALDLIETVLSGEAVAPMTANGWADLARWAFAAGHEDLARRLFAAATEAATPLVDESPRRTIERDVAWLDSWWGVRDATPPAPVPGTVDFALVDTKQPNVARTPVDLGDAIDTLAVVAQLARRTGVTITADDDSRDLLELVDQVRGCVRPDRARAEVAGSVRLGVVHRSAASWSVVPEGTWSVVHGSLVEPVWGLRDFPPDPRLRPLYWSVQIASSEVLTPAAIEHLRACAPIGCRDLTSAALLTGAGVPAFVSGDLAAALGDLAPARSGTPRVLRVDTAAGGRGRHQTHHLPAMRSRDLAGNLRFALDRVADYAGADLVVTTRPVCYAAARALGTTAEFRSEPDPTPLLDERAPLPDERLAAVRAGLAEVLDPVLDAVLSGAGEEQVRSLWRERCAPRVAALTERIAAIGPVTAEKLDIEGQCAAVRELMVTMERTAAAPDGAEVAVELSLDQNYRHQLGVVLESIVEHCSRPVRAFVLCRGLTDEDYRKFATAFPTVSFVWLPTSDVDYGADTNLLPHITVSTMDRLLLPSLLPEVARIIHHDLDAASVGDLAELADLDLGGAPLAARWDPFPFMPNGYEAYIRTARRIAYEPERAQDLLLRLVQRHRFDFSVFNAGVMVLDLDRMRADDFTAQWVPFATQFGLHDQETLIAYAGGNRAELPEAWNTVPGVEETDRAKLLHWAGKVKPWTPRMWAPGKHVWVDYEHKLARRYENAGLPVD